MNMSFFKTLSYRMKMIFFPSFRKSEKFLTNIDDQNHSIDDKNGDFYRLAVVQYEHQNFKSSKDFHAKILSIVKEAKSNYAKIVLFPAGMNMELYSVTEDALSDSQLSKISEECLKIFSNVAYTEKIILSYADLFRGKRSFHLLDQNGKSIEEKIFTVEDVKISFIDYDSDDVDLILNPSLMKKWVSDYESFAHAWLYSQQKNVFSAEAYMVGDHFVGQSGIYAPLEATDALNGILKQAQSKSLGELLIEKIDFSKIKALKVQKNDEYDRLFANKK